MRIFKEEQQITQWWIYVITIVSSITTGFLLYKEWQQANNTTNLVIVFIILLLAHILVHILKLHTKIDEVGITYQLFPLQIQPKQITWKNIKSCRTRQYSPIKEYGGWGLRWSFKNGRAYNLKGNKGIQIVLHNNKKILIGTQQPDTAQKVIDKYFNKTEYSHD